MCIRDRQWNAAHGSTTLVVHGTRRCCDPPVRPPCWRRMRHNGLHGSITMEAKYEHHLCGSMQRHSGTRRSRGTSWARSVRQCGRDPRPTASMAMRAPRRGVARTHRAAMLAMMMRYRTTVATTGACLILGQLGAPGCRWQPHGGVIHVTVVQSSHRWESVPTGGMTAPPVVQPSPAPPLFAVISSCGTRFMRCPA